MTTGLSSGDLSDVRGPVLRPGDPGFAEEILAWNLATVHTPSLVVGATSAQDVAAAVRCAAAQGLPVGVQATGHGADVPIEGGLLITTRRMAEVTVDPDGSMACVGAGVSWRAVIDAASPHGLAPLSGSQSAWGSSATPSVVAWARSGGPSGSRPTMRCDSRLSRRTARSGGSTPSTTRICSGRCAAARATSAS